MALTKCPKCNNAISDKSKKCIKCGCKIKKTRINKKVIATLIFIFSGIISILFVITFITSQVSIKQYFALIAEKNFSCVFGNHHWKNATCEIPKHCLICNAQKGKPIEHRWKEADCINNKVCLYCKKTEGSPLGHKVNIGYCNRCNNYVNKYDIELTVIKESIACINKSYNNIENYFNVSSSEIVELYYCELAQNEAINIKKAACIAKDTCGNIEELTELKQCFAKMDNALSGNIDIKLTYNNYISYANMLSEKLTISIEAYNKAINEINNINRR